MNKQPTIIETGFTTLNYKWKKILFKNTYQNPVVIVSDPSYKDKLSCVVRIKEVSSSYCI